MKCVPAFNIDKLNSVGASEPSDGPAGETASAGLAKVSVMVDIVRYPRTARHCPNFSREITTVAAPSNLA